MIERKFSDDTVKKLFGHYINTSDDGQWGIANPIKILFGNVTDAVNVYDYFEEKGYDFVFALKDVMYFRRKKK